MIALRIIDPGMLTTVQDAGRPGFASLGVPPSGAANPLALLIGNRILGNDLNAAALEATMIGPTFECLASLSLCIIGASVPHAFIERRRTRTPLRPGIATPLSVGDRVSIGPTGSSSRCLICLQGGIACQTVLTSRSTLLSTAFGGHMGRALRAEDLLEITSATFLPLVPPGPSHDAHVWLEHLLERRTLRILPGVHYNLLASTTASSLTQAQFRVSSQSSRMGIRLIGDVISLADFDGRLPSEPTVTGAVQVPPDGQPIILGPDRPTTGGYPMIATVIEADWPVLASLKPADQITFQWVDIASARRAFDTQQAQRLSFFA